jgi:phosphoribosylformylglycinamidine synthase
MDLKKAGNPVYVIGTTCDEMGGSIYLNTFGLVGNSVPKVDIKQAVKIYQAVHRAIVRGLIVSAHDCSEGGLAVALAEMAFAGNLGVTVLSESVPFQGKQKREDTVLFSESNSRLVVEVPREKQKDFEQALKGVAYARLGQVEQSPEFVVYGLKKNVCMKAYIQDLKEAWKEPLNA